MEISMKKQSHKKSIYLIHLLSCALKGLKPCEKPYDISYKELLQLAEFHSVANLAYYAIEKLEDKPEAKLLKEWSEIRDMGVVKSFTQLTERDQIIDALTREQISVLPLKGCLMKEMYPQVDMRMMADLDMLIHFEDGLKAKNIMESLGYQVELFQTTNHDIYIKPPVMEVELHTQMVHKKSDYFNYYEYIWEKVSAKTGNPYLYEFGWDDYYIFLITHFAKHYYVGGSGIRSIMDIYIFLNIHKDNLNEKYLEKELKTLNLWEFKEEVESIAQKWFDGSIQDIKLDTTGEYIIKSGTYGTVDLTIQNDILKINKEGKSLKKAKITYFLRRAFMNKDSMKKKYNILIKLPFLMPVFWVYRLIYALIKKRKRVKLELRRIIEVEK